MESERLNNSVKLDEIVRDVRTIRTHITVSSTIMRAMPFEFRERRSTERRAAPLDHGVLLYLSNTKSRTEYIIGPMHGLCMRRLKSRRSSSRRR